MVEWDVRKSIANERKHQIPFSVVKSVFEGPLVARRDVRFEYGEERWFAIGLLEGVPVVVIYTKRDHRIRIISARKADRHERQGLQAFLAAHGR